MSIGLIFFLFFGALFANPYLLLASAWTIKALHWLETHRRNAATESLPLGCSIVVVSRSEIMTNSSNNSDGVGVSYEEDTLNNDVTMTTSMTTTFGSNATDDSEDMTTVNLDEFVQEVNEEEDDTRDICNSSQINSSMDKEGELGEEKAEEENINDNNNNNKDERSTSSSLSTITISTTANDDAAIICSSAVLLSSSEKKKMEEVISSSTNHHHHHHPSSNKLLSSASSSSGDDILVTTNNNSISNNSNNSTNTMSTSSTSSTIPLSTLPIDAIHSISTYCTINDWYTLCITSKLYYYNIGPIIISKCYGHVYRCALEVAYCWVSVVNT